MQVAYCKQPFCLYHPNCTVYPVWCTPYNLGGTDRMAADINSCVNIIIFNIMFNVKYELFNTGSEQDNFIFLGCFCLSRRSTTLPWTGHSLPVPRVQTNRPS